MLAGRARVIAVTRRKTACIDGADYILHGDIADPDFCRTLPLDITEIIHCAADVRFTLTLEQARRANVIATRNLLDHARRCARLERVAQISTVYVAGTTPGEFDETPIESSGYASTYEQSKHEAEALAFEAMREIPVVLYRLSVVLGAASFVYPLLRLAQSTNWPDLGIHPDATADVIPAAWAIAALDHLHQHAFQPGRVRHVCAGPNRSISIAEIAGALGVRFDPGAGIHPGRLRALQHILPHLRIHQEFRNEATLADLECGGLAPPVEHFIRLLFATPI